MPTDKNRILRIITFLLFLFPLRLQAEEIASSINFSAADRILILAPHPDDEAIGTAGVIQKALKAGAEIKITCFTNGDHNQLAFIVYEKRLTFRKGEFLHMGEVRRKETIQAMESLGLGQDDIVFLGYPDFGTMEILTKYWSNVRPYKSLLTRVSNVPYSECLSYAAPYVGESIIKDLKTVIYDFKPTKIFVSHPVDTNRDHRALYLFLQIALWDLEGKIVRPEIYPYLIHVVGWPKPRGYHSELGLLPPKKLKDSEISWHKLELTEEEIKAKYNAISFYKSQIEAYPPYLFTFARKNELFGDYPIIKLKRENRDKPQWQGLKVDQADEEVLEEERNPEKIISTLAYGCNENNLFIRLTLKRKIDKDFGLSIFLLGYSKEVDFARMPKIHLTVDLGGLYLKEKKQTLFIKDADLHYEDKGKTLIIKVPLSTLGEPHYILNSASSRMKVLHFDETAWRIIELDN